MNRITIEIDLDADETIIEQDGAPTAIVLPFARYQALRNQAALTTTPPRLPGSARPFEEWLGPEEMSGSEDVAEFLGRQYLE